MAKQSLGSGEGGRRVSWPCNPMYIALKVLVKYDDIMWIDVDEWTFFLHNGFFSCTLTCHALQKIPPSGGHANMPAEPAGGGHASTPVKSRRQSAL